MCSSQIPEAPPPGGKNDTSLNGNIFASGFAMQFGKVAADNVLFQLIES